MFYCRKSVKVPNTDAGQVGSRLASGTPIQNGEDRDAIAIGKNGSGALPSEGKPSKIKGMLCGRKKGYANFSDEDEEQGVALSTATGSTATAATLD